MQTVFVFISSMLLVAGCGCGGPGQDRADDDDDDFPGWCEDPDGDGYGEGEGCAGPDCNESVPDIHEQADCDDYCRENGNLAPGCPCDGDAPQSCYGGAPETLGVGSCRAGTMECEDGTWGFCGGQVLPGDEACDEADNDCDGATDEEVLSPCGDCSDDCEEECIGRGCPDPFDPEKDGAQSVVGTEDGGITLDEEATVANHVIWVANSGQGTVTKIDTRERVEKGRYWTGWGGAGDSPSRTTVNPHGDVVVANRGGGGEATKYLASECPDRDGDGVVETSTGAADVYGFQADECWAWTTPVGCGARGSAFEVRAGLDGSVEEFVWVGDYCHGDIHELDSDDGALTGRSVGGLSPYGAALGPDSTLWTFSNTGRHLVSIDTETLATESIALPDTESWYGITVDPEGRVWIGSTVARYDPAAGVWESPPDEVRGGGIACDADGNAYTGEGLFGVWSPGDAWKIDGETLAAERIPGAGGHGWAVDFDGFAWSIEFTGTRAFVVDPESFEVETITPPFVSAYTYSDMTGFQLVNATNPVGLYPHVFEACEGMDVHWALLSWDAVVPAETSLTFRARTADTLDALAAAPWVDLAADPPDVSPVRIDDALAAAGEEPGHLLYLEVTLRSLDREARPVLESMSVSRSCESPID